MSVVDVDALLAHLWPEGDQLRGQQVYMLVDGACDSAIAPMIRHGKLEWDCLFSGPLTPRLQAAAPYLVHLAHASALTRELLTRGWAHHWGMLMTAPADVTQVQLRQHFKKFLRVRDEDGAVLAFRFYDPRVLRVYLPSCSDDEARRFIGPLSRIVVADTASGLPLDFSMQAGRLRHTGRNAGGKPPVQPTPTPTPDALLAMLATGRRDADLLAQLRRQLPPAEHALQQRAMTALTALWRAAAYELSPAAGARLAFELGMMAAGMLRWRGAAEFFEAALRHDVAAHATHFNLGLCYRQLARHDDAERHFALALAAHPGDARYAGQLDQLRAHRERCRAALGGDALTVAASPLSATLLGRHHAAAWLRRLEPATARQARLPLPDSLPEARRWIREQQALPMSPLFAVLDPEHGLIGGFGVEQRHNAALFHYWVGADFQGRGHAHAVPALLLDYARRAHVHRLYSAVDPANTRSRAVLRRAGFHVLPHAAEAGPDGVPLPLHFLLLAPEMGTLEVAAQRYELQLLLGDPASVLILQEPAAAAAEDGR